MNEPALSVAVTLGACAVLLLAAQGHLRAPPAGSLLRWSALGVVALLLAVSGYPASWRLPDVVAYLAVPTLHAFRLICVTATGALLFGGALGLLYWARKK